MSAGLRHLEITEQIKWVCLILSALCHVCSTVADVERLMATVQKEKTEVRHL
jgi:hypothetical protein